MDLAACSSGLDRRFGLAAWRGGRARFHQHVCARDCCAPPQDTMQQHDGAGLRRHWTWHCVGVVQNIPSARAMPLTTTRPPPCQPRHCRVAADERARLHDGAAAAAPPAAASRSVNGMSSCAIELTWYLCVYCCCCRCRWCCCCRRCCWWWWRSCCCRRARSPGRSRAAGAVPQRTLLPRWCSLRPHRESSRRVWRVA